MRYNPNSVISEDLLRSLSDDALRKLFLDNRGYINRARRKRLNTRRAEEDLCWIQLEIKERGAVRKTKRK